MKRKVKPAFKMGKEEADSDAAHIEIKESAMDRGGVSLFLNVPDFYNEVQTTFFLSPFILFIEVIVIPLPWCGDSYPLSLA